MFGIRKRAAVTAIIVLLTSTQTLFAAEAPVTVFLNGSEINYDVPPQIISGRTMVPLRGTIESITGEDMEWDDATKTVAFKAGGKQCRHTIGERTIFIDGVAHDFDTPSLIIDSHTLVPVRMIAETSGLAVEWDDETRRVNIGPAATKRVTEGISLDYEYHNVTGIELPGDDGPNYIGGYMRPVVTGLGEEALDSYVNKYLADAMEKPVKEFEKDYNDLRVEIDAEQDLEMKENLETEASRYTYQAKTFILTTSDNYCAFAEPSYEYRGGAHPNHYLRTFNFDISEQKFITLKDIFKDAGYKSVIEGKLNEIAKTDEYKDRLFQDTTVEIEEFGDGENFYLTDDKLVIFYQPSEIGPYAAGFIVFEIPLAEIVGILKDEYETARYKNLLDWEQLFEKAFEDF